MNVAWYVRRQGGVFGPASTDRVQEMIRAGRLTRDDEVATTQEGPFVPIRGVRALDVVRPLSDLPVQPTPASASDAEPREAAEPAADLASPYNLPEKVKLKYVKALASKGSGWVLSVGLLAVFLIGPHVPGVAWLRQKSWGVWVLGLLALMVLGGALNAYESWRMRRLAEQSDKMLEVMYNEHRQGALVSTVVQWVIFLIAAIFFFTRG